VRAAERRAEDERRFSHPLDDTEGEPHVNTNLHEFAFDIRGNSCLYVNVPFFGIPTWQFVKRLFGQAVFSVAGRTYFWEDVVLAAMLWGEWAAIETRARRGLACLTRVRRSGERLDTLEIEKAADAFRYKHDLISGDETKAWLARWGLTVDGWMEYIQWTLLSERSSARSTEAVGDVDVDEAADCVLYEAICSGDLARLARKLAGRVAVADRAAKEAPAADSDQEEPREATRFDVIQGLAPDTWPGGHAGVAEGLREKVENLGPVERRYSAFLPQIVTPKAVAEQIRIHYLDWIWLECETTAFATEDMAKEVALGVHEDGMTLAEAAAEVGWPAQRYDDYMDGFDATVKTAMLAASSGELVGPFFLHGQYFLLHVLKKIVPSKDNPETAKRAKRAALEAALAREINDRVQWHWRL
jgi:hypothetical protein